MAISEQLKDLTNFALTLSAQEGEDIPLDVVYDRWWQTRHRDDDLIAVQEAHAEYEAGERGELAREELANSRAERSDRKP